MFDSIYIKYVHYFDVGLDCQPCVYFYTHVSNAIYRDALIISAEPFIDT